MLKSRRFAPLVAGSLLAGGALVAAQPLERLPPVESAPLEEAPPPPDRKANPDRAPNAVTLADLEGLALANNPSLAQAAARVEAARGAYQQAGLPPNPRLGYEGSEIGNEGGTVGMQGGYVAQEFVRGGKLQYSQAVACRAVLRAQQEYEAQRLRVLTDIRTEYYRTLAAQHRLDLAHEIQKLGANSIKTIKTLIEAGTGTTVDLLQGRIELESAEIALESARVRHAASWRRLASLTGLPELSPSQLDGDPTKDVPEFDYEQTLARLLAESPELASASIEAERTVIALERARREPIPNVDVMLGAQKDFMSGDTVANVQVELPIPFWNKNQGGIYQARGEMIAAQAEVGRVEMALRNRLAGAFERYQVARFQVERYDARILPDAREALKLTTSAYENGQVGFLNVLSAQRTYVQTNLARLDAATELRETAAMLEGLLLSDSLQAGAMPPTQSSPPAMSRSAGQSGMSDR